MRIFRMVGALVCVAAVAGCLQNDAQRGVAGAVTGAAIAGATGSAIVGVALVGGAAGVFCRNLGIGMCHNN